MSPARKATRPSKKKPAARKKPAAKRQAVIRMYDVGFGDAFLVRLPTDDGIKKILLDCGTIKQGANNMKKVVARIIKDVTDGDGVPRIDLVVGTHRHKDHVSGFADSAWNSVEVGEVWMPWTEDPKDPRARKIRETQAGLALHLSAALTRMGAAEAYQELALNALSNENAMATLHDGFKGNAPRRFYPSAKRAEATFLPAILPGVTVHVMGPSREESVIRDMDPPAGESYLRLMRNDLPGTEDVPVLFGSEWVSRDPIDPKSSGFVHLDLSPKLRKRVEDIGSGEELAAVVALDKAVNGTSLMLMFKVGRTHLLFPGDAQWGTWKAAMEDDEWRPLLKKTVFYKVGHHGSHNATPKDFVADILGDDIWAMASVKPVTKWPSVPREELLTALRGKTKKVVRSDMPQDAPSAFHVDDFYVEAVVPIE